MQEGSNGSPGIIPRALEELFRQSSMSGITSYSFSISMLEVYLGNVHDLLAPKPSSRPHAVSRCNLNIQTDPSGSVEIEGLTVVEVSNFTKASWWYAKGRRVRSTSWTNVNEASSRSHCLTRITIYRHEGEKKEASKLWLVDLGGSERLLKTGATGQTLDEGRAINLSLSARGDVIAALRRKRGHVPYRNSKLTQILRDSLGDGSKALMIVHVSPCEEDVGETACSFTFARRAGTVKSIRELPVDLKKQEKKIAELEEEMNKANEECAKVRREIQSAELEFGEKRKLFFESHCCAKGEKLLPFSPKEQKIETITTPKISRKRSVANSMPRFMGSTVESRERQSGPERQMEIRTRSFRNCTRSLIQISSSQSFGHLDPRLKPQLRNPNKKSRNGESTKTPTEDAWPNHSDSKPSPPSRNKAVISSVPSLKVSVSCHRRRMSDL